MACVKKCSTSLTALGFGNTPEQEVAYKLIAVKTYDSTGAKNAISLSATLNQAFFDALVNNADLTKRWYPLPEMKQIVDTRADNQYFDFDDNTQKFIREGVRKCTAMLATESGANTPQMKELIEQLRCDKYSFYIVTTANQLIGNISSDEASLEPIKIDSQSVASMFVKKTNTTPQHNLLSFTWSVENNDAWLRLIDCEELGGANLMGLKSLLSICYKLISVSQTQLKIKLYSKFGTPINPIGVPYLVKTDFISSNDATTASIYNATTASNVTIVTATESPASTYTLTYASQAVADSIVLKVLKTGFDFSCVVANPITIA